MKKLPFDLEKAKAGAKLVTRDGRPARIIRWDRDWGNYHNTIVALINDKEGVLNVLYTSDGRHHTDGEDSCSDLFILEEPAIRPYANAEEILKSMKEHGPMVKHVEDNEYHSIVNINNKGLQIGGNYDYTYEEFKGLYAWQDDSPCGVREGGEDD